MSKIQISQMDIELIGSLLTALTGMFSALLKRGQKLDISTHYLFLKAELNKTNILTYFTLENKGKEVVFKEILCRHMDIYHKHANTLCEKYVSKEIDSTEELYAESSKTLDNIIRELSTFFIDNEDYTPEEQRVLTIVMKKYNHWNQERQNDALNRMMEISNSAFYPTLNNKMVAILDALMFAMNDTVSDANKTLNSINGDLKGLVFQGVII